jgi:outer membrane protein assembly factor BamB
MRFLTLLLWPILLCWRCEAPDPFIKDLGHQSSGAPRVTAGPLPAAPIASATATQIAIDCAVGSHVFYLSGGFLHHVGRKKWDKVIARKDYDYPHICAADDGRVLVPVPDKHSEHGGARLFAFTLDGRRRWSASPAANIDVLALTESGEIVASETLDKPGRGSPVHFLEKFSSAGKSLWRITTGASVTIEEILLAVGPDGTIYSRRHQGGLVARQRNGIERWISNPTTSDISAPSFDSHGNIYVTDWQGIYALDSRGVLRWKRTALTLHPGGLESNDKTIMENAMMGSGARTNQPAIADDDTIYLAARSLYAFTQAGELKWVFTPETHFAYSDGESTYLNRTPILAQDGTIYITTYDHQVYAIDKSGKPLWREPGEQWDYGTTLYLAPNGDLRLMHSGADPSYFARVRARDVVFATRDHGPLMRHAWPTQNHDFGNSRRRKEGE